MTIRGTVRQILGKDLKETGVAGVFNLFHSLAPWNGKRIETNKQELLRVLADALPWRGLRFGEDDSWFVEKLSRALPVETAASPSPGWLLFEASQIEPLSDVLHLGSWALYFSRRTLTPPTPPLCVVREPLGGEP